MAKRRTIHILKNNQVDNGALPTGGVQMGEPLVNLYNGILFFSGVTGGNYVQSNSNPGYFEIGSNLYNLELRNQITRYQNTSGVGLEGKFLSGTTTGFVLADISTIQGVVTDSYTTGATWSPNVLTLTLNNGKPDVTATINSFTGLNLFGTTNATNLVVTGTSYYNQTVVVSNPYEVANVGFVTAYTQSTEVYVTGGTITTTPSTNSNSGVIGLKYNQTIPNGTYTLPYSDSFTTGATLSGTLISFTKNDGTTYSVDLNSLNPTGFTDTYVTGFTYNNNNTLTINRNQGKPDLTLTINQMSGLTITGNLTVSAKTTTTDLLVNGFVLSNLIPNTGCTYDLGSTTNRWDELWVRRVRIGTCTTDLDDDGSQFIISVGGTSSGATFNLNGGDLNVAGDLLPTSDLTYDLGSSSLRWKNLYANNIASSALTVTNLTPGQVVYVGSSNELKTDTTGQFAYNDLTNTLTLGTPTSGGTLIVNNSISNGASTFGQGGLIIGSGGSHSVIGFGDLTVHGNLFVFGTGTTIATNELYIEDPQITLNYNPSGSTAITSIASGLRIQDGNGVAGGDVYLTVAQMNTFTGGAVTEYTGPTGYSNRAFLTQLNDIVIRNTNINNGAPDGVRVLAEFDILDGGVY
jgi:hypothetical protein